MNNKRNKSTWSLISNTKRLIVFGLLITLLLILFFINTAHASSLKLSISSSGLANSNNKVRMHVIAYDALNPSQELYSIPLTGLVDNELLTAQWDVPKEAKQHDTYIKICITDDNTPMDNDFCGSVQSADHFTKVSCPYFVNAGSASFIGKLSGWNTVGDEQKTHCSNTDQNFRTTDVLASLQILNNGVEIDGGGVLVSENGKLVLKNLTEFAALIPVEEQSAPDITYLTTNVPVAGPAGAQGLSGVMTVSGGGLVLKDNDLSLTKCANTEILQSDGNTYSCRTITDLDAQTLTLASDQLFISNGNMVDLSAYLDNTDSQALSWNDASRTLTLTDGGSVIIPDADTTYGAGSGLSLTGTVFNINSPSCNGSDKLSWDGTNFSCGPDLDTDTNSGGTVTNITAGTGLSGGNITSSGTISISDTGVLSGTYGSSTEVAVITVNAQGQLTNVISEPIVFPAELDGVIGNEVVGPTGNNAGLIRGGSGTVVDPYTLAVNVGNGLQISSNQVAIIAPICAGSDKLSWNGTAFLCENDIDTNTDQQTLSSNTSVPDINNSTTTTLSISAGNSVQFIDRDTIYSSGTGISFSGTTINNTGILSLGGSGAITSSGGQNPNIGLGTTNNLTQLGDILDLSDTGVTVGTYNTVTVDNKGRVTSGSNVAYLTNEVDAVIGNEVTDVTAGSGLFRSGSGTAADPYKVGLLTSCATNELLKWNGAAWVCSTDIDTNTDQQTLNLTTNTLSISGGNTVDLSAYLDNTDSQALSWNDASRTLTLTNGGSVIIPDADTNSGGTITNIATGTGLTGGPITTTGIISIANTGVSAGVYGSETTVPVLTINAQGQIISASTMPIPTSDTSTTGLLTSADWNAFNGKENVLSFNGNGLFSRTGNTVTGLACSLDQIPKWIGGLFTCSNDTDTNSGGTVTSINTGNGLTGGPITNTGTISINSPICTSSEFLSWNGATFNCMTPVDTALCATNSGPAGSFCNNGNAVGAIMTLGTNDAFGLNFETSGITAANISSSGEVLFKDLSNSAVSFQVQNSLSLPEFSIDTVNNIVQIGSSSSDSTAIELVLDSYNTIADPAGVNGAMYYNSSLNKFRCYENGAWKNCLDSYPLLLVEANRPTAFAVPTAASIMPFTVASTNIGGSYNTTTGIFTAPSAGTYQINVNVTVAMPVEATGRRSEYNMQLFNNTGSVIIQQTYTGSNGTSGATFNGTAVISRTVNLTSGEQISIRLQRPNPSAAKSTLAAAPANTLQIIQVK